MNALLNFIDLWWHWTTHMFWQVGILVMMLSLVDVLLRDRVWPQVRYALWLMVLIKLMLPPGWSAPTSIISQVSPIIVEKQQVLPAVDSEQSIDKTAIQTDQSTSGHITSEPAAVPDIAPKKTIVMHNLITLKSLAFIVWVTGMLVFITLLFIKTGRLRQWHRQHNDAMLPPWFHELLMKTTDRLHLNVLPLIVFSPDAKSPAVYGLFKPVMLLPARYFDNLDKREAEHVLLHELAHLKRGDLLMHTLSLFLQVIYWYNPLVHWTGKQIKHVREICCDLTVANILKEKTGDYRQTLINTARTLLTESPEPGLAFLGVFEEPFRLVSRIKWLEKKSLPQPEKTLVTAFVVSLMVIVFVLPMSGMEGSSMTKAKSSIPDIANDMSKMHLLETPVINPHNKNKYYYQIENNGPFYAITLDMDGPGELLGTAMHRLQDYLQKERIHPDGPSFIVNKSMDFGNANEHELQWSVGYPVAKEMSVPSPFACEWYPSRKVLNTKLPERYNNDLLNKELSEFLLKYNLINNAPSLIYCPDKLYKQGWDKHWLIQIPVEQSKTKFPQITVHTKWTGPMLVMIRRWSGNFEQEEQAKKELLAYLQDQGIQPKGKPFYRYLNDEMKVEASELQWDVGVEVPKGTIAEYPYEIRRFPAERVVTGVLKCNPDDIIPYVYGFALEYTRQGFLPTGYPMRFDIAQHKDNIYEMEFRVAVRKVMPGNMNTLPSFY